MYPVLTKFLVSGSVQAHPAVVGMLHEVLDDHTTPVSQQNDNESHLSSAASRHGTIALTDVTRPHSCAAASASIDHERPVEVIRDEAEGSQVQNKPIGAVTAALIEAWKLALNT